MEGCECPLFAAGRSPDHLIQEPARAEDAHMSERQQIDFDIDRYLRNSKRLDLSELPWDDIPNHRLSDGDVMCMHYMMDIETHTVIYLRDLLATRAANDPYVTAFLSCWVYEELWHGEAFSDFLRAYGIEVPAEPKLPDGSTPMPTRPNRVKQLRTELGVGHQLSLLPTMLGLGDDEGLRRRSTWRGARSTS